MIIFIPSAIFHQLTNGLMMLQFLLQINYLKAGRWALPYCFQTAMDFLLALPGIHYSISRAVQVCRVPGQRVRISLLPSEPPMRRLPCFPTAKSSLWPEPIPAMAERQDQPIFSYTIIQQEQMVPLQQLVAPPIRQLVRRQKPMLQVIFSLIYPMAVCSSPIKAPILLRSYMFLNQGVLRLQQGSRTYSLF